jgi:membrane-bound ClpP family serine protease
MKIALTRLLAWLACAATPATLAAEKVGFINVDGAIGPATAS